MIDSTATIQIRLAWHLLITFILGRGLHFNLTQRKEEYTEQGKQ